MGNRGQSEPASASGLAEELAADDYHRIQDRPWSLTPAALPWDATVKEVVCDTPEAMARVDVPVARIVATAHLRAQAGEERARMLTGLRAGMFRPTVSAPRRHSVR